ncbi:MAG: hypothetical protein HZY73_09570 [Micropruina sp.]|nr:MAG: hypothetical protein HZY73_09570 [Micropruina sp.]
MSETRALSSPGFAVLASNWRAVRCMLAKSGRFSSSQSVIRAGRSSDVDTGSVIPAHLTRYLCQEYGVSMDAGHDLAGNAVHVDRVAVVMVTSAR